MALPPACGYNGCEQHPFGINHDVEQTAQYKNRKLLCRLGIHPHSKSIENGAQLQCVRCGTKWRYYCDL